MDFREMLAADLREVFLDPGEFAESVELAGHEDVPCVCEPLELTPSDGHDRPAVSYEGLTIYVSAAAVPDELHPQRETTFRGQRWFVLESSTGESMRTIRLYRERT